MNSEHKLGTEAQWQRSKKEYRKPTITKLGGIGRKAMTNTAQSNVFDNGGQGPNYS